MKKYNAMVAVSLVLATAFISIQGVDAIIASPLEVTGYSIGEFGLHTDSNAGGSGTVDNYGEWIILREPTMYEDGLKKREYISTDGTRYEEYEVIPRLLPYPMPLPSITTPPVTKPVETTESSRDGSTKDDSATKSNVRKHSRHRISGKQKGVDKASNANDVTKPYKESTDSTNREKSTEATTENIKSDASKRVEKSDKKNDSSRETTESRSDVNNITSGTDNNIESSMSEPAEMSTEIDEKSEVQTDITEQTIDIEDSTHVEQESEGAINVDAVVSKDKSFNRYDGATILAAGAYTWWVAIVLLPMINALKWINKKRREKSRSNVNKKYN